MRVLIAGEDKPSCLVLCRLLEKLGHTFTAVSDGDQAWNALTHGKGNLIHGSFDVLIADTAMSRVDGLTLCRRIRAASKERLPAEVAPRYLYVVLLGQSAEDRLAGLDAGADDIFVTPLNPTEISARLEVAQRILGIQAETGPASLRFDRMRGQMERNAPSIGEILVAQGVLTPDQLRYVLGQQSRTGHPLGPMLIANGWVTDNDLAHARSIQIDVPYVDPLDEYPDPELLKAVPLEIAQRHHLLPLSVREGISGETVRVAVADPWNVEGLDIVARLTGKRAEPLLAAESSLQTAIERAYRDLAVQRESARFSSVAADLMTSLHTLDNEAGIAADWTEDLDVIVDTASEEDQAPVIRLVNVLLADAVRRRASDIHVEAYKKDFEIRYRIDGELFIVRTLPRAMHAPFVSCLKVMAEMDISERRLPQDGRISQRIDGKIVDLRVSSLPTQYGERIVVRVLDRAASRLSLDQLQFSHANERTFKDLIRRPHGLVLVTGPKGSGKTTTLYAALNALQSPSMNIMTCEDPIEYELDRVSQSAVNVKTGMTFATHLRAILRQDPDVILVGEIRDAETADIAFRAAMTGHLVLSTLHCHEAASAPTRLIEMGVAPFLIAYSLIGVITQRLVKKLCPYCRREEPEASAGQSALVEAMLGRPLPPRTPVYRPVGCSQCNNSGSVGRVAIHEMMLINDRIQTLIMQQVNAPQIRSAAREAGMVSLAEDGVQKALKGLTTLEEVEQKIGATYAEALHMQA